MESTKPIAVPPLKATHSHLSFCLRSTSSLLGPTAAAAQASISGENDSSEFSGLEGVHAGDQESTARAGGEKGGAVAGVEDENVRQRDPATSLFSDSSIKINNTGKMDLADARWRAMNGEKKWLDVNEAEGEGFLSSAASGSDRSTMNTRHSETGFEGESLSGCDDDDDDDDDEGTLDLVEGALLRMLSRGGRPKHHQTSNREFNGLEGSSGQHTAPSARIREVSSSNAVKDTELLAKLLDQVHHLKKQRDLRSGEPQSSTHVEDRTSRHRSVGREKKTASRNDELRMTLEAASEAAKAAADAAQAAAISVSKNTSAIELLTRALPGSNVTQLQGQESGRKLKSTVEETGGTDTEDKTQKAIVKQNKKTHWILGFMVVTTIAWRFGVVKTVNRVRSKLNNPMDYVGGLLGGGKVPDSDDEEDEPQKKNILEQIKLPTKLPSLLAGDSADNTESKPDKDASKLVEPQAEVVKEEETVFNFGNLLQIGPSRK